MPKYVTFTGNDVVDSTTKVTTGFFSGGTGTLASGSLTTASLGSQMDYYYNLQYSSEDQLSVSYGHFAGSGSDTDGAGGAGSDSLKGQTQAIYQQFASTLLPVDDVAGGFKFDGTTTVNDVFFITAERARMKDRVNKKNWTITLSGSGLTAGGGGSGKLLHLTDDSSTVTSTASPVGPRYNIKSGSAGSLEGTSTVFGHFYPNVGIWALNGTNLSASIPGTTGAINSGSREMWEDGNQPGSYYGNGFAVDSRTTGQADNAFKLAVSLMKGSITLRDEEDQNTVTYFVRAGAQDFNFSNNPTFTSGSDHGLKQTSFEGNPTTYITTVGLYNSNDELVAVGRLSKPLKKNYASEATIKVNLTY